MVVSLLVGFVAGVGLKLMLVPAAILICVFGVLLLWMAKRGYIDLAEFLENPVSIQIDLGRREDGEKKIESLKNSFPSVAAFAGGVVCGLLLA
jgi:uncharacterized membrane protein (Fun14 family)